MVLPRNWRRLGMCSNHTEEALALGEKVPHGPASARFLSLARDLNIYVVIGMTAGDGERLFNTSAVFGPTEFVGRSRKVHLWDRENLVFEPGDLGFPVFDTPIGRIATFVCYDGWFPEDYRACVLAGADLVCIPTNWVPIPGQGPTRAGHGNLPLYGKCACKWGRGGRR